jgi:hypothetical protein
MKKRLLDSKAGLKASYKRKILALSNIFAPKLIKQQHGMLSHVNWWFVTEVSLKLHASIFRIV